MLLHLSNKQLLLTTLSVCCYFSLLFVNSYFFNYQSAVTSVLQELVTIPMLLLELVLLVLLVRQAIVKRFHIPPTIKISLLLITLSFFTTYGSLVFSQL